MTTVDDAKRARSGPVRIALVDPLGDFGIGAYTYELAEGLAGNGVSVDVYCSCAKTTPAEENTG
ncbi:MAG: hypothetical protein ACRD2X_25265 [Vicinamibacteraceae bacterium]